MKNLKSGCFIFILFLFASAGALAQGSGYYIRNYLPKEYKGYNQVWQAAQDKNGFMYFAATTNVFIYSGQYWEKIQIKTGAATRQVYIDPLDGTVYIASVGDFGYIERDKNGTWKFISMLPQLNKEQQSFNDVWKIYSFKGAVYFQASERIFKTKDKKITGVIEAEKEHTFALSFISNGHFYVRARQEGLMEIINDKLSLVPGGEIFKEKRILSIIPFSAQKNIVLTGDQGFLIMSIQPDPVSHSCFEKKPLATPDEYLTSAGVLGCKWIRDSTLVVNSRAGLAFYDNKGRLKEILNKASGLSDESIADVFIDREKNLWLVHNNGVSSVAYNSPVLVYGDKSGFTGNMEMLGYYKDDLYAASSDGLFVSKKEDSLHSHGLTFLPTKIVNVEIWDLFNSGSHFFVSSSEGLIDMHDDKTEWISGFCTNQTRLIENTDNLVTAEKNGLSIFKNEPGKGYKVVRHYHIPGEELLQTGKITKVPGTNDRYTTWVVTRFKNVLNIEFGISDSIFIVKRHSVSAKKSYADYYPVYIGDSLFFCTADSCYRYAPSKANNLVCFENDPATFKRLYNGTANVTPPFNFKLFFTSNDSIAVYGYGTNEKVISKKIRIQKVFTDGQLSYMVLRPDGKILTSMDNSIISYDSKKQIAVNNNAFSCLIREVIIGKDSTFYPDNERFSKIANTEIPYAKNHILFKFEAPFFYLDDVVNFTYKLEGYDTAWSGLSPTPEKDFSNLPEGSYTFRVKASNSTGKYSNEVSCSFVITPPWYRSYWAYFMYFAALVAVVYMLVRISATRLRKQKEKLEQLVKERTAEVMEQKQMLETAYVEIQDSIHYAKRIQTALLASDKLLSDRLKEYFIFYKPKDIVSGDFYWAQPKGDWLYMITADCTGHGVPGAFMSLLNISFLNEAINLSSFVKPDEILSYVRTQIIDALKSDGSEEGGKDGMDCVLCAYNFKTKTLLASLSNNPVLIVRNKEIIEIKPDKFPVGKHDKDHQAFTLHEIQLQDNDVVYTFTDGYPDQFGGLAGKKFKHKQLKQLLVDLVHLPMDEQKAVIEKTLLKWKGKLDQVDDILVIGLRV